MRLFTIGFTKKSAETFFETLRRSGVKRVVDVRLNNVSQLAGFAKRDDLRYFLEKICQVEYVHAPDLAPTQPMLEGYRKGHKDWATYEQQFRYLMQERRIENRIHRDIAADDCFLCSEDKPHYCHRRLVVEYLRESWGDVDINHLC